MSALVAAKSAARSLTEDDLQVKSPEMRSMPFCFAIAATLCGEVVEIAMSSVGMRSWSRMQFRTREPKFPLVPVRRIFIVN